ncbi:MAG: DUF1156 domain-containing protein [Candidatus Heimdallarchaeota archaeon]|nr:DUF1156 domain-containing protein [Candidatus Heimdallarchaeota archaeon]
MENQETKPKLIEISFPFSSVSLIAYKESNAKRYYRPVLTLHKWFARRLSSVFRSILIYSALSEKSINTMNMINASELEKFWTFYLKEYDFKDIIVFDPFMGGGTTIIEAVRLGFSVIGGDLNPVAWFTVKKQLESVDLEVLNSNYNRIVESLYPEIQDYYKTICTKCSQESNVMYFFWIKRVRCEKCENKISLFRSYLFAYDRNDSQRAFFICPNCAAIFNTENKEKIACNVCLYTFKKSKSNVTRGKYHCPECKHFGRIIDSNRKFGRPEEYLYAIEYYCDNCDSRFFKKADIYDIEVYKKAEKRFKKIEIQLPIPSQSVPVGAKTQELLNHQISHFKYMFNSRQLLTLGLLLDKILEIKDRNIREFLLITFSTALEYNNLLCEYHRKNHYIYNLFRKHAFPATLNPVENNVLGTSRFGTGSFRQFFKKTLKIKEYCQNPYETYISADGKVQRLSMNKAINSPIVYEFRVFEESRTPPYIYCSSSTHTDIPSNYVDLVITDPPYSDNVQYAELSDFYYVWLRIDLQDQYAWFKPEFTPKNDEIVKNTKRGKSNLDYQKGLIAVFRDIYRVLKSDGLLIFTFHHKQLKAWGALMESLIQAKFSIINVYPVRSEMVTSTQIRGSKSIEIDAIFVCKKAYFEPKCIEWDSFESNLITNTKKRIKSFSKENTLSKQDRAVIKVSESLRLISKHYPHIYEKRTHISIIDILERIF